MQIILQTAPIIHIRSNNALRLSEMRSHATVNPMRFISLCCLYMYICPWLTLDVLGCFEYIYICIYIYIIITTYPYILPILTYPTYYIVDGVAMSEDISIKFNTLASEQRGSNFKSVIFERMLRCFMSISCELACSWMPQNTLMVS